MVYALNFVFSSLSRLVDKVKAERRVRGSKLRPRLHLDLLGNFHRSFPCNLNDCDWLTDFAAMSLYLRRTLSRLKIGSELCEVILISVLLSSF